MSNGNVKGAFLSLCVAVCVSNAFALDISNRFRSPRNAERDIRRTTELIVLHTTEAPAKGSINKVSERGECHYVVTEDGDIYRIVDRDRVAFHAGRSMWRGKEDVDTYSIGIECVGYHDKPMPMAQLNAIRDLVKQLRSMYHLSSDKVVCHGHVAYGAPNRWQKKAHRGRKRCGMLFATLTVRRILELDARPASDADVKSRRLVVADEKLNKVLYGKDDFLRTHYASLKNAKPSQNESSGLFGWFGGSKKTAPAKVTPSSDKKISAVKRPPSSIAELQKAGYRVVGQVSKTQTAAKIAGSRWNASDTYYTIRDKVVAGNMLDPARIEKGMSVWLKK